MHLKKINLNSIRSKLVISLVSMCIIPLIISMLFSYNQSKSILKNNLSVTSKQTLSEVNQGLINYFNGFTNVVTILSNNYDILNVDQNNNFDYVPGLLGNIKEANEDIVSAYYGTASGKITIYPSEEIPDDYDATKRPWYEQAIEAEGKVIITSTYTDAITGENIISIAKAVVNEGQTVGVVGVDCTLSTLADKIATKKIGDAGYVFITSLDGYVLAHPNKDLINTDIASKLSFWEEAKSTDSGFVEYDYDEKSKFGVYQTNELTGWKLFATLEDDELLKNTQYILTTNLMILVIMLVISLFTSMILSKGISFNIRRLKEVFAKASNGDLSTVIEFKSKDELGELGRDYNSMIKNISQLLESAKKTSNVVLSTASNISSMAEETNASMSQVALAVTEISQGANNLAENSQETAIGVGHLSEKLNDIEEFTKEMNNVSQDTKELSDQGINTVNILINKNNETMEASMKVSNIVSDMASSVKEISTISDAINSITEQTNLLSLNASIEAARAGEAGRGFSVVAEEIRKLAEQSKGSTQQIRLIIETIQSKAKIAVQAMDNTKKINLEQNQAVGKTEQIFTDILLSIRTLTEKVENVKKSIETMQVQKQIFISQVENTSAISEETASATEEVIASAEEVTSTMEQFTYQTVELQDLAEKLKIEIDKFKCN